MCSEGQQFLVDFEIVRLSGTISRLVEVLCLHYYELIAILFAVLFWILTHLSRVDSDVHGRPIIEKKVEMQLRFQTLSK